MQRPLTKYSPVVVIWIVVALSVTAGCNSGDDLSPLDATQSALILDANRSLRDGSLIRALALADSLDVISSGSIDAARSEEHTSELQSRRNLVCRLLLEKKKNRHDSSLLPASSDSSSG